MQEPNNSTEIARSPIWPSFCLVVGVGFLLLSGGCLASVWLGANTLNSGDQSNKVEVMKRSVAFSSLVIPFAAIGGVLAVLGLVFRKRGSNNKTTDTQACPNCGRQNAATTKTCPRCETQLE